MAMRFLRTFLSFIPRWSEADEVVRQHLGDLLIGIEAAFSNAGSDICEAAQKGEENHQLDAVHSKLVENIEIFKPRIKEAYNFLSNYAFRSQSPVTELEVWNLFCIYIEGNALDGLVDEGYLTDPLKEQVRAFQEFVYSFRHFISCMLDRNDDCCQRILRDVWIHAGGIAVCSARLMYLF
ncbi:hypothetical protein ACH5RR_036117 [Cinchona calisaya]|uniref:Uncharacterized protein n=1 Tax=Cinchona calisaya TaxID=153742 RepID=A0ABD2Y3H8_9GENT